MWTIGREREKEHAARNVRADQLAAIHAVIDAAFDLHEGRIEADEARDTFIAAFVDGGAGVWEQTESWLRRLATRHPGLSDIWVELSRHKAWKVRWRVSCVLDSIPPAVASEIGERLCVDRSKKVREYALDRLSRMGD